jgi:hypothetical protein
MKIYILIALVVVAAVVMGGLPKLQREKEITKCVAGLSEQTKSPLLRSLDKEGYCGCLLDKGGLGAGASQDQVLASCMGTYVKPEAEKYCSQTLNPHMNLQGATVDCNCFYEQTVLVAQMAARRSTPTMTEEEQKKIGMDVTQKCVKARR